jgi:hypothetical protein
LAQKLRLGKIYLILEPHSFGGDLTLPMEMSGLQQRSLDENCSYFEALGGVKLTVDRGQHMQGMTRKQRKYVNKK